MNPFDMMDALDNMVCLVDSREQDTPKLRARLKQMGCKTERRALSFGDYSAYFPLQNNNVLDLSSTISIERKMSIDELCTCFCQGRDRFEREFERAKEANAKIYLLVENACWEHIYGGKYRSRMRSTALVASILAWLSRYNCQVLFCRPEITGKLVHDILYREGKERLERSENGTE